MSVIDFDFYADVSKKNSKGFNDALPIGNGHIGAMIYGDPQKDKMVLNENTFWLGKKGRIRASADFYSNYRKVREYILNNQYEEAERLAEIGLMPNPKGEAIYSTAGLLWLETISTNVKNYHRKLDMKQGLVEITFDCDEGKKKRTFLASYPKDCIYICYESDREEVLKIQFDREKGIDKNYVDKDKLFLIYGFNQKDTLILGAKVVAKEVTSIGSTLLAKGKKIEILLSMATNLYHKNVKKYVLSRLNQLGKTDMVEEAIKDYQKLYQRQELQCDCPNIKRMYDFSRYLMISSSRKNLPANLQGLWNQDIYPSWDSKYTLNINLEMNYWGVFESQLFECSQPVFHLLKKMDKNGKRVARRLYHVKGFVAHHNTDIYGDCYLQDHYLPATVWILGGAWLSLMIFEAYEYTQDIKFLKKYGYILADSAEFLSNMLILDAGEYVLCPSLSPENSFYWNDKVYHLTKGSTMDQQIINDVFQAVLKMKDLIPISSKLVRKIEEILPKLAKTRLTDDGRIAEWKLPLKEAEKGHRHLSHLYGLFPSDQFDDELKRAALKSLNTRLENGSGHTGWSKAWIICLYARLHKAEEVWKNFEEFMRCSTSRVGLDLHPPFQIDGNFGVGKAILEMVVHINEDTIEILPALPKEIQYIEWKGIALKGGYILDITVNRPNVNIVISSNKCVQLKCIYQEKESILELMKGKNTFTFQ